MKKFVSQIQAQFDKMCQTGKLFRVALTGKEIWHLYLGAFTPEEDPMFRDPNSSSHNCNNCSNFIRRYGNIVAVDNNGKLMSIFDVEADGDFVNVARILTQSINISPIVDVFFETFTELNAMNYEKCSMSKPVFRLGLDKNIKRYTAEEAAKYGVVKEDEIRTFNHFHLDIPTKFIDNSKKSVESIMGGYRDKYSVFKRAMEEISLDTLKLVKDLINQGSLLDGATHTEALQVFITQKETRDKMVSIGTPIANWYWVATYDMHERIAKFKNTLIGVLCSELSEGEELNKACQSWNKRVDPANYMKVTAPFTEKQRQAAMSFVVDNGYGESFNRRVANIDDIKVSEILHANVGKGDIKSVSIFDGVKATKTQHKRSQFDGIEEVTIDKFMADILPSCTAVDAFLENRMSGHMVTLTTATNPDSKPMFKWSNPYSWTFNGNLAGKSQLTEMVEAKGGRTDGAFRFTHSWNELEPNQSLMDLHVFMPGCTVPSIGGGPDVYGRRVGWNNRKDGLSGGTQDVDYTNAAPKGYIPVENITFPDKSKMPEGKYTCKVHNWNFRVTGGRGKAEIAFDGNIYQYEYPATKHHEWITVAVVTLKDGKFSIEHNLPIANETSKEIYGLETNEFHKVKLVCLSPNHWGDNQIGNKHYFFMLDGCKSPVDIRSFHNENLIPDMLQHKQVLEALGNKVSVESLDNQLSGLGFNATVKDELIVKLSGSFKRVVKIKF